MKPNALIIEDDADTARLLGMLLDRNGWRYEHCDRVDKGVKRANSHPFPEVILLDLNLPDSPAWMTEKRIPELMRNGPVLVLSNYEDPAMIERINAMGAFFAIKDTTGPVVFDGVMRACEGWRHATAVRKKQTDKIDLNLLQMQAILSKNAHPA